MIKKFLLLFFSLFLICRLSTATDLSIDSIFKKAHIITLKTEYPTINWSKKSDYPLNGAFASKKSKLLSSELFSVSKGISASCALGNNYFTYIEQELKKNNLPLSYKWIPFTLSGMIANHYGQVGRAGLWQIPYVIGIKYQLTQTPLFDERMDYKKNTDVAIQYIKTLITEFGDTTKALSAYFNGEGAVKHAYAQTAAVRFKDQEAINHFIYEKLPVSTRDHLYLWNELAAILSHPKNQIREKFTPESMTARERVLLDRKTNLMAVANVLDIPSPTLKAKNPTLVSDFAPKDYYLLLPLGQEKSFTQNKEAIYNYQDSLKNNPKPRVVKSYYVAPPSNAEKIYYRVRSGDNLGAIATKYHVGLSQLKGWNGLRSDMIYAGQKLVIYGPKNANYKTNTASTTHSTTTTSQGTFINYTVKSGDSLWGIAQKYPGVSPEDIQKWNNIGERIDIGQVLKIKK